MTDLERAKSVEVDIVCIQESYVGGVIVSHPAFNIKWGTVGKRKEQRVPIGIAVSTRERLIVEAQTDIIYHSYIMALDLWELERLEGKKKRSKRVINVYDNNLRADQVWKEIQDTGTSRRRVG